MRVISVVQHRLFGPALGAVLTMLCGLALWQMTLGERWVNASYDYLFRFGARGITNQVALIFLDNEAYDHFHQTRPEWNRARHAELLNKLADDGCPLVVFDLFFRERRDSTSDESLAEAMRRHGHVVLMAEQAEMTHPSFDGAHPILPSELFLSAASTNTGIAWLDPDLDLIVRRHWPFPSPGPHASLPETVAHLAGAKTNAVPENKWIRYYGANGAWVSFSYHLALGQPATYFRDKIVFIGNKPATTVPDGEVDKFRTPYTRWTGRTVGGVEILATEFLNLMNRDWLRRAGWRMEVLVLALSGLVLAGMFSRARPLVAWGIAAVAALVVTLAAVSLSHFTNFWFPWLVIAGGQVPCALVWTLLLPKFEAAWAARERARAILAQTFPDTPDYELFDPPFGEGAYGKVWLVRNAVGQWQALKAIYLAKFGNNYGPYDREFSGIQRYKPISEKHPGLLYVDFVSRKKPEGYFYYVMELGDSQIPGWEQNPAVYKPRDLANVRAQAEGRRLPVVECVRIGLALADALEFLHQQGLTHRDIKPSNVIFVHGRPKLADVGLVAEIKPADKETTSVGTPGYMPPAPEPPGTPQADIYGLGMVLYVISTGREPSLFPELSASLVEARGQNFLLLNSIILRACHPDRAARYGSAAEMREALMKAERELA